MDKDKLIKYLKDEITNCTNKAIDSKMLEEHIWNSGSAGSLDKLLKKIKFGAFDKEEDKKGEDFDIKQWVEYIQHWLTKYNNLTLKPSWAGLSHENVENVESLLYDLNIDTSHDFETGTLIFTKGGRD